MRDTGSRPAEEAAPSAPMRERAPALPTRVAEPHPGHRRVRQRLSRWWRQLLAQLASSWLHPRPERSSGELTTLPPPTRGHAMREAHRTLRLRLQTHPALRQMLPHLSYIERSLAKRGSRVLMSLPMPVLQRGLEQLALLQRDDETPAESVNLRVLRLRLIEAMAVRSRQPDAGASLRRVPTPDPNGPITLSSDLSTTAFDEAEAGWAAQQQRQRERAPH